jgi:hypothetical protein
MISARGPLLLALTLPLAAGGLVLPKIGQCQGVWSRIALPPHVEALTAMEVTEDYIYGAFRDSSGAKLGLFRTSAATPGEWESLGLAGRYILGIVPGSQSGDLLVGALGQPNVLYSSDGGFSWIDRSVESTGDVRTLRHGGGFPGITYAYHTHTGPDTSFSAVFASIDFGQAWTRWGAHADASPTLFKIAIPGNPEGQQARGAFNGTLFFRTTNGGQAWFPDEPYENGDGTPIDFEFDAFSQTACTWAGRWVLGRWTADGWQGEGYTPIFGGSGGHLGLECPEWHPGAFYLAGTVRDLDHPGRTKLGVFVAEDWQGPWESVGSGLPDEPAPLGFASMYYQFRAMPQSPKLVFATYGQGLYMCTCSVDLSGVPEGSGNDLRISVLSKNPADGPIRLSLSGNRWGRLPASIDVLDVSGRMIRTITPVTPNGAVLWDGFLNGGGKAPAGVYLIRARDGAYEASARVVMLR